MPRFFDVKKLTVEEKDRFATATIEYKNIQKANAQINYQLLTKEDKEELKNLLEEDSEESFKQYILDCTILHNGDEKSALFYRLLHNKAPLIYPPPCAYSYPWYSIIEENRTHELLLDANSINELLDNGEINIEQTAWEVLEIISPMEAIVTYGQWKNLGFKWKLSMKKILCANSVSYILSHHDLSLSRITTLEQLKKEQQYHVLKSLENILMVLQPEKQEQYKQELVSKHGNFGATMFKQKLLAGEEMLFQRLNKRLSDYPTEIEIQKMIDNNVNDYLEKEISVDENGNLLTNVWQLEKISPLTNEGIYLDNKLFEAQTD